MAVPSTAKANISAIMKEQERLAKKQHSTSVTTLAGIDKMIKGIETTITKLCPNEESLSYSGSTDMIIDSDSHAIDSSIGIESMPNAMCAVLLSELHRSLKETGGKCSSEHRDFHSHLSKFGKIIDKHFTMDTSIAANPTAFSGESKTLLLNRVVAQHLYREGRFLLAELFVRETGLPSVALDDVKPFVDMYYVLEALRKQDLVPALAWVSVRKQELERLGSRLEFTLHRLEFIRLLHRNARIDALAYARTELSRFSGIPTHMRDLQRLMCSLAFLGDLENSPYSTLLQPAMWDEAVHLFTRDSCTLLGLSHESHLFVAANTGCSALPTLLKMATVLKSTTAAWSGMHELPVEVDLGAECQFHSVFACPVSKEASTAENPPMMLPCGHVICQVSLMKLSKGSRFKCPYCPSEAYPSQGTELYF